MCALRPAWAVSERRGFRISSDGSLRVRIDGRCLEGISFRSPSVDKRFPSGGGWVGIYERSEWQSYVGFDCAGGSVLVEQLVFGKGIGRVLRSRPSSENEDYDSNFSTAFLLHLFACLLALWLSLVGVCVASLVPAGGRLNRRCVA